MATISTHTGSGLSQEHNRRDRELTDKEPHIDPDGVYEVWMDIPLEQAYHIIFDQAVDEYNVRQNRPERRIDDYLAKIKDDKKKHPCYEMICGVYGDDITLEDSKKILQEFCNDWHTTNRHMKMIGAYFHADEEGKNPHVHIDYVPVADGYKRGMEMQTALDKALRQQGFDKTVTMKDGKVANTPQIAWEQSENERLEKICNKYGIKVEHPQKGQNVEHLNTQAYKATKKLEQLEDDIGKNKSVLQDVREQSKNIRTKNIMASASLNKARKELNELTDEVEDKKTELEEIRGDVDHLLTVKRELNEDIEQIKDEKEQLQRDVQELNHDIYNLEAKKDSIESEITETQSKLDKLKGMLGDFERTLQTRVKGFVRGVFDSFQKVKEFVFETSDGDPDILGTSAESIQFIEEEAEKSADAKFDEVIADPVKESISEEADKVENEIEAEYPVYKSVRRR